MKVDVDIETKRMVVADLLAGYRAKAVARLRSLDVATVRAIAHEVAGAVKPSTFNLKRAL